MRPYAAAGIEMAKLALKPQVAAFLEIVTSHGGPDLRFEEIEIQSEYPQAGRTIRELRVRSTTGAVIVALRKQDGTFDTTPEPDVPLEIGDVLIAIGTEPELRALEDLFAPKAGVGSNAVDRLAEAVGALAGREVALERPKDASLGDYATNVALQSAKAPGARRASSRRSSREARRAARGRERRGRGAGLRQPPAHRRVLRRGARRDRRGLRRRLAGAPERIQVECVSANPTGPITVASARNGAYGDSVARLLAFAGTTVEREYYFNDAGGRWIASARSVEAARRGEAPPEDGYHGAYIADLAREAGRPGAADARADPGDARALPHPLRLVGEAERARAATLPAILAPLPTYEADGALYVRSTDFGDEKDRVLLRSADGGCRPTRPPTSRTSRTSSSAASTARSTCSAPTTTAVAGWYAVVARMLGYDPARVEVLLYQFVHLTRGGEQTKMSKRKGDVVFLDDFMDEVGVDAARWYLVNRGPDQTIEIDIDLAAEKTQKNPVYYVQYAHARIAGILRNAPRAPVRRRRRGCRWSRPSASS